MTNPHQRHARLLNPELHEQFVTHPVQLYDNEPVVPRLNRSGAGGWCNIAQDG
ncbi:MAG: hypothetical protein WCH30_01620 [Chlorobiaceae bacterium]